MKAFDMHVHIFPDKIARQTVAALGEDGNVKPTYDGSRAGLLQSMASAGIDGALNCPIATRPDQVESINRWAAAQNVWPVLSLGTVHPDCRDMPRVLQGVRESGLSGIKLHPEYQAFTLDDPRVQSVWRHCVEFDLAIVLHCGEDIAFDPPYHSAPDTIRACIERHPGLKLVATHFGSWMMWDEVETELIGKPVYLDVSFAFEYVADERLVRLSRQHGIEWVLFGTDAPWREQKADLAYFHSLPFTDAEKEQILWHNSARLFGF